MEYIHDNNYVVEVIYIVICSLIQFMVKRNSV